MNKIDIHVFQKLNNNASVKVKNYQWYKCITSKYMLKLPLKPMKILGY